MLVFRKPCCIPSDGFLIYNFTSMVMGYKNLRLLPPYTQVDNSRDFDIQYAYWIHNDQEMFMEFMEVVMHLYMMNNIFILIDPDDDMLPIVETLLKLIQQKYGYNGYIINVPTDWYDVKESSFTKEGLEEFDRDRLTYITLRQIGGTLNV